MREVYTMERCLDHLVHALRVLDVYLAKYPPQVHVVLELWGESGVGYRARKGYGRLDAQPANHVRMLVLHVCRALSFLHHRLGMSRGR